VGQGLTIRKAAADDAAAIARGERETAATPGMLVGRPGEVPLEAYAAKIAALRPLGCYWVAEEDGEVVGHAFLDPMAMAATAHVFHLTIVVHPGFTGRGVGRALMTEMLGWARTHPVLEKIELRVRATNARALALYLRSGFVEEGRLRRRVRIDDGVYLDDVAMAWFKS
jgi:RimJ/RimL family protein N-acetyltransferase